MLPAQRFESFSQTQNLGFTSFKDIKTADVLNTVTNKLQTVTDELSLMADSIKQNKFPSIDAIKSKVDENIRSVRDTFSTLKDITNISQSDIEAKIASMLPGDASFQNAFRSISRECRDNAMSKDSGFKPFKDNFGCGKPGSGKCSSSEVSGLFNKLTGGALGNITRSIQSMLSSLMALANMGYTAGLCKIFAALTSGMADQVVQRGSATLLATFGGIGNMNAVFDITANMGRAIPSLEVPGLVGRITDNFKVPDNYGQGSLASLYEGSMDAYSLIQPGFDKDAAGSMDSLANMGHSQNNPSFIASAKEFLSKSTFGGISQISTPVFGAGSSMGVAYASNKISNPFSSLGLFA